MSGESQGAAASCSPITASGASLVRSPFFQQTALVAENTCLARDTYRIRLLAPTIARIILPGQFLMLRLPKTTDPLLGRPYALYDTVLDDGGQVIGLDVVYLVVGKQTRLLAQLRPEELLEVWGPLGNSFPILSESSHIGLVAGGIGQTPFLAYTRQLLGRRGYGGEPARRLADRVSLYYGVRSADLAAGLADFETAGAELQLASDDGTLGYRGFVTQLLAQHGPPDHLIGCGPAPMLRALASVARSWRVPCHVSLETPMACGAGICFSCVTKVQTPEGWDYRRVCVDGPVFDAASLVWD